MKTIQFINNQTTIILNNSQIYTIDPIFSIDPKNTITFNNTTYYYQGELSY